MPSKEAARGDAAREAHEFEELLSEVFARFAGATPEGVDDVITWSLGEVVGFLGGQRAGIFLFSPDKRKLEFKYSWQADGAKLALNPGETVPAYKLDWVIEKVRRGGLCIVRDRDKLPRDAVVYLTLLEEMNLEATVNVPLFGSGSLVGIFGFGTEHKNHDWSDALLSRLQLVARVFSSALERKKIRSQLLRAEECMRVVAQSSSNLIFQMDVKTGIADNAERFDEILGYEPGERPNSMDWWEENLHPDDREQALEIVRHSLETGEPNRYEARVRTKRGDYRTWAIRSSPVMDDEGKAVKLIGAVDDITEERRAEAELRHSEAMHRAILNSFPEEVVVLDAGGRILSVNDTWRRFAVENNIVSAEAVSPGVNYLDACRAIGDPEDETAARANEGIAAILSGTSDAFTMEYPCHCPCERRWFLMHAVPLRSESGGAVVTHTNITRIVESAEELKKAYAEIESLKDRLEQENLYLREHAEIRHDHGDIVGESREMKHVLREVEQVASSDASVLIQGETGTGKELIASAIHNLSRRKQHTMVKVNCGALPSTLIESELFGREKGAYTGAATRQIGRFDLADGSTLFLDEVGELPSELQAKLLRVLESGEFERLGSPKTRKVDVRIIAATNRDLSKEVEAGNFREDLFYRLNVFPITVPPLRERPDDIPLLVWAFVKEFGDAAGKPIETVSKKDLEKIQHYPWPGNVRELRNAIERAVILCDGKALRVEVPDGRAVPGMGSAVATLDEMERAYIIEVLKTTGWRVRGKSGAAQILDINEATLRSRMKKLGIERPR